jgi:hypothetical protein
MKTPSCLLMIALIAGSKMGAAQPSEPGVFQLADLFSRADKVALVKVVSGTTEVYKVSIYKAQVVRGFKGLSTGETIYFGPYLGTELGSEYILFLRDTPAVIEPKANVDGGYGRVRYLEVFDEGYSAMRASYECVFAGGTQNQHCDYGVRVCTDYIKLPRSLPAFTDGSDDPPFGCRWVKKDSFISALDDLRANRK